MAEATAELTELGDRLAGLTLKQAVELASYLKETHGIEAAAGGGGGGGGGAAAVAAPAARSQFRRAIAPRAVGAAEREH